MQFLDLEGTLGEDVNQFACENDKPLQEYLKRIGTETCFTDIQNMSSSSAWCCVAGRPKIVPPVDKFAAGWLCCDYSIVNQARMNFVGGVAKVEGKSSKLFNLLVEYLSVHRPTIFIGENVLSQINGTSVLHVLFFVCAECRLLWQADATRP